ncbi:UNVERIFIED_ORG: hypothetical protein QE448_001913 [Rhizobium sp. SORGH_AS285]|nr:hypothetical protein [Rhizobium sp. SORGH_AS_0285]
MAPPHFPAKAVVGVPMCEADGLGDLAQQFLFQQVIAIKRAGVGKLVVARQLVFGHGNRNGDSRFAGLPISKQDGIVEIRLQLGQLIGGKQGVDDLFVMLQDKPAARKGENMSAVDFQGIGNAFLRPLFRETIEGIFGKSRQQTCFGMGGSGFKNFHGNHQSAPEIFFIKVSFSPAA